MDCRIVEKKIVLVEHRLDWALPGSFGLAESGLARFQVVLAEFW